MKQDFSNCICLFLIVIDTKTIPRELLDLANLLKTEILDIHKLLEVVLISEDKNFVFAAFQIIAPSFKDFNNNWEFLVVSFVASLDGNHFLIKIGYRVLLDNFGLRKI